MAEGWKILVWDAGAEPLAMAKIYRCGRWGEEQEVEGRGEKRLTTHMKDEGQSPKSGKQRAAV